MASAIGAAGPVVASRPPPGGGRAPARVGDEVTVPAAPDGSIVIVDVTGMNASPADLIRTFALRAQDWYGPFRYGPAVSRIAVGRNPSVAHGSEELRYEFIAIPVDAP